MLGRKVQSCHSEKSIGMMNKILEAFKKGRERCGRFLDEHRRTSDVHNIHRSKGQRR
ncbi:MAG: hypothetical protein QXP86_01300 [Nitrososphaerota archaeon]